MHILVKLLGTLSSHYPGGSYTTTGLDLEVPEDLTVVELVERLGVEKKRVVMVTINGYLAKADDTIPENSIVKLIQPVSGG